MSRGVWLVVGGVAGAYGARKVRRAAEAFTYDGIHDRLSGLFAGARIFTAEMKAGTTEKKAELQQRLDSVPAFDAAPALEETPEETMPALEKGRKT
ncbi:MAG: hypothetical protein HZY75_10420 [Nocardioidaceae bacterium]|nr:MAG: hypothetical protein HZY75_10420 [Nocardioidaceae bacterium]